MRNFVRFVHMHIESFELKVSVTLIEAFIVFVPSISLTSRLTVS